MSVLIKDMEKPKSCYAVIDGESEYCPFVNTDDDCVILLKKGICEGTWADQYSKCPLVEEPKRKKGKWLANGDIPKDCPFCGEDWDKYVFGDVWYTGELPKFCPNCGADMRGEQDDSV